MPQTAVTKTTPVGPYPIGAVGAGALALTMQASDTVNGNSIALSGSEILIVQNTDSSAHTFTITSVADQQGRSGDVTNYSVAANSSAAFSFRRGQNGWQQADGTVHMTSSSALLLFGVLNPSN